MSLRLSGEAFENEKQETHLDVSNNQGKQRNGLASTRRHFQQAMTMGI
jgi:hypothetical protein